jgi:2-keto-4-pentenoate hydratase/2-oxohepta-3-ene-1,7-dioic acid hydratase in catechol pathway
VKLVTFEPVSERGRERLGALREDTVVDLSQVSPKLPPDMLCLLDAGAQGLAAVRSALDKAPAAVALKLSDVRLRAPLRPRALRDFFAYEDHALQGAARRKEALAPEWYDQPVYYKGNHREIYGPGDTAPWPNYTRKLDFELEVACVVGRKGRDLPVEKAAEHIFGFMLFNDWSARDIQKNEMVCRMGPAKGKDFANSFGPWLVTADEVGPEDRINLSAWVNGEEWSSGHTGLRYWSWAEMLSHVSQSETVYPGDVLGSGTYFKGCGLDLDRWLKPGDRLELKSDKLGTLSSIIGAPAAQVHLAYRKQHGAHR